MVNCENFVSSVSHQQFTNDKVWNLIIEFSTPLSSRSHHYSTKDPENFFLWYPILLFVENDNNLWNSSKLETSLFDLFSNPREFCTSDFNFEFWYLNLMKFKPYVLYLLLRMAHLRGSNSLKIPQEPRGIGSRFPHEKCNPRFPESPRNEHFQGIGIQN